MDIYKMLLDTYNCKAYTNHYIFGFTYKKAVYMVKATADILPLITTTDTASGNGGKQLKFHPTNAQKELLLANGYDIEIIMNEPDFLSLVKSNIYNAGDNFEWLIYKHYNRATEWTKDHTPFWQDGDITIDGIAYQVKYDRATFLTETMMNKLRAC